MSITQGAEFGESIHSKSCSKIIANHIYLVIKTPLLLHIKYSQTNTEAIPIVLSFYCPLKKEREKKQVEESSLRVTFSQPLVGLLYLRTPYDHVSDWQ